MFKIDKRISTEMKALIGQLKDKEDDASDNVPPSDVNGRLQAVMNSLNELQSATREEKTVIADTLKKQLSPDQQEKFDKLVAVLSRFINN